MGFVSLVASGRKERLPLAPPDFHLGSLIPMRLRLRVSPMISGLLVYDSETDAAFPRNKNLTEDATATIINAGRAQLSQFREVSVAVPAPQKVLPSSYVSSRPANLRIFLGRHA